MTAYTLHDPTLEAAVLGAALDLGPNIVERLTIDHDLQTGHFAHRLHAQAWDAIRTVWEDTRTTDHAAIATKLATPDAVEDLEHMAARACHLGALTRNVQTLKRLAERRQWQHAAHELLAAAEHDDEQRVTTAENLLRQAQSPEPEPSAVDDLFDWFSNQDPAGIPTGYPALDSLIGGGMRAGDVTALGGWTGTGKSLITDGILIAAVKAGKSAHLLMNEMSKRDRRLRLVARAGAAPYARLVVKDLRAGEHERVIAAAGTLPFDMTDVAGWPADRVARWIRSHPHDLVALDVVHNMPFRDTRDIDEGIVALLAAARVTGTHLLLVCHLNDARAVQSVLPSPVLRDIRNTGMIARVAANVVMLHRPQTNQAGFVSTSLEGFLDVHKARHGRLGAVPVRLDTERLEFVA